MHVWFFAAGRRAWLENAAGQPGRPGPVLDLCRQNCAYVPVLCFAQTVMGINLDLGSVLLYYYSKKCPLLCKQTTTGVDAFMHACPAAYECRVTHLRTKYIYGVNFYLSVVPLLTPIETEQDCLHAGVLN